MGRAIAYDLAGRHFATQKELEEEVTRYLADVPRDTEFKSRFLRDIINNLNPQVTRTEQRSDGRFKLITLKEQVRQGLPYAEMYRGGEVLMTYFNPLGDWRDATAKPWRKGKQKSELSHALRVKAARITPTPGWGDRCAFSGCTAKGYALRYHHVKPTFEEIVTECIGLMTEEERSTLFGYNKFAPGVYCVADCIPDDHPAILRLHELHEGNTWDWLCEQHHRDAHRAEQ